MISYLAVAIYRFVHGSLKVRGGGTLLRRFLPFSPGLRKFPIVMPGVGVAIVDFRDATAYTLVNYSIGDFGNEVDLLPSMESFFRAGDVLWDVGSNAGSVAAHFAHPRFAATGVECFEPNPQALQTLRSLFAHHPLVRVHACALGDVSGPQPMRFVRGSSHLSTFVSVLPGMSEDIVSVRRGDELSEGGSAAMPDLIKIDAEGFEPQVLDGLAWTIKTKRPVIFYEDVFSTAQSVPIPAGYRKMRVGRKGRLLSETSPPETADSALVPEERLKGSILQSVE